MTQIIPIITALAIPEVKLITPAKFGDNRGFFSEVYKRAWHDELGFQGEFIQDNFSRSAQKGTVRGLHFQTPPFAQDKLVRVTKGRIWDVAVDIRPNSPTYGQHVAVELSFDNFAQLFIPAGFAHGFCTLEDDSEILYKVSAPYAPQNDAGIIWNDADLNIPWPVNANEAILSQKDVGLPSFSKFCSDLLH